MSLLKLIFNRRSFRIEQIAKPIFCKSYLATKDICQGNEDCLFRVLIECIYFSVHALDRYVFSKRGHRIRDELIDGVVAYNIRVYIELLNVENPKNIAIFTEMFNVRNEEYAKAPNLVATPLPATVGSAALGLCFRLNEAFFGQQNYDPTPHMKGVEITREQMKHFPKGLQQMQWSLAIPSLLPDKDLRKLVDEFE